MRTLNYDFSPKHREYMRRSLVSVMNVAEGAVRAGKTVDNVFAFAHFIETSPDRIHLATGSTIGNARLNLGDCNGLGLEAIFRGRCRWGRFKGNECLFVRARVGERIIIFAGGAKSDSFKRIRGNSYGMWLATEINLHHDSFIREAFNRQLAAKRRKIFWDLNPSAPGAEIYTKYIDRYAAADFPGGYNYAHFTIFDNPAVSAERLSEIEAQYDSGSVWYRRDILGERCAAEGLIFRAFADEPERYSLDWDALGGEERRRLIASLGFISVGVDFGGNRSLTTFVAVGITPDFGKIYVMADHHITGQKGEIDPGRVNREFIAFIGRLMREFPGAEVRYAFCDSEAQYLINGLRRACRDAGLRLSVGESMKRPVRDRIQCTAKLLGSGRMVIFSSCRLVADGLRGAMWDSEAAEKGLDVRLDNFSSDIDILDAEEYAWERFMPRLTG
ncbi:MAG: PBSX family phage terminase large subunit [Oscillospiraceae bacterium]|nr:PBSX family phage terminase large subunit [Oscillospiraceae bacterium]